MMSQMTMGQTNEAPHPHLTSAPAAASSTKQQHRQHHHSSSKNKSSPRRGKEEQRRRSDGSGDNNSGDDNDKKHRSNRHSSSKTNDGNRPRSPSSAKRKSQRHQQDAGGGGDDDNDNNTNTNKPRSRPWTPPQQQQQSQPPTQPSQPTAAHASFPRPEVANTRLRVEGSNGRGCKWVIHSDTPGGHAAKRLRLIKGVELDEHEYDEVVDLAVEPGPAAAAVAAVAAVATADVKKSPIPRNSDVPPGKPERKQSQVGACVGMPELPKRQHSLYQQETARNNNVNANNSLSRGVDSQVKFDSGNHLPKKSTLKKQNANITVEEYNQSTTWDNQNDLSLSEDDESIPAELDQVCENDNDDDEEEEEEEPRGYIKNYGYATSPGARQPKKKSVECSTDQKNDENATTEDDEQSIDPMAGFKPYEAGIDDSLSDIEDSFACDTGGDSFPNVQAPQWFSTSQSNDDAIKAGTNHTAPSPSSQRQKPGTALIRVKSGRFSTGALRRAVSEADATRSVSTESTATASFLPGPPMDSSARYAGANLRRLNSAPSADTEPNTESRGGSRSDLRAQAVANFATGFCGPSNVNFGVAGHNSASSRHGSSGDNNNHSAPSMESMNSSESSVSSAYSFGVKGMRMPIPPRHVQGSLNPYEVPTEHEVTPFMQFDVQAAHGVHVVQKTNGALNMPEECADDSASPSILEFDTKDLPQLEKSQQSARRETEPEKGSHLQRLGNRRKSRLSSQRKNAKPPRKPPSRANSSSSAALGGDVVKRFFSFANSSFGSLQASSAVLDDDDHTDEQDMIFE